MNPPMRFHMSQTDAAPVTGASPDLRTDLDEVRAELERVLIIAEAMWQILQERHGCTEEELVAKMRAIDLRDGREDQRVKTAGPMLCPTCRRPLSRRRPLCLYCGAAIQWPPFER